MNGAKEGVGVAVALAVLVLDALAIRVSLALVVRTVDGAGGALDVEVPLPARAPGATSLHWGCAATNCSSCAKNQRTNTSRIGSDIVDLDYGL